MTVPHTTAAVEAQIDQWRSYLRRRQAIKAVDIAELEDHLREQIAGLTGSGLSTDEAFLVAVKRMGDLDSLSREFALFVPRHCIAAFTGRKTRPSKYRAGTEPGQALAPASLFRFFHQPVDCRLEFSRFQSTSESNGGTILRLELQQGEISANVDSVAFDRT